MTAAALRLPRKQDSDFELSLAHYRQIWSDRWGWSLNDKGAGLVRLGVSECMKQTFILKIESKKFLKLALTKHESYGGIGEDGFNQQKFDEFLVLATSKLG